MSRHPNRADLIESVRIDITSPKGVTRTETVPASASIGIRDGRAVGWYGEFHPKAERDREAGRIDALVTASEYAAPIDAELTGIHRPSQHP